MTGADLLRTILLDPADDLARLAYADLLEERGGPGDAEQAGFIRVQLALADYARQPGRPTDPAQLAGWKWGMHREALVLDAFFGQPHSCELCLERRETELLDAASVPPGFNDCFPGWVRKWSWSRGFVCGVSFELGNLLRHARTLFAAHPVTSLEIVSCPQQDALHPTGIIIPGGDWPATARQEWFWRITSFSSIAIRALAGSLDASVDWDDHHLAEQWDTAMRHALDHRTFDSSAKAVAAFHAACTDWGRSLVGLPPLSGEPGPPPASGRS